MGRQNERRGRLVSFWKIAHVLGQLCFAGREALVAYDLSLSQINQYIAILIVWQIDLNQTGLLYSIQSRILCQAPASGRNQGKPLYKPRGAEGKGNEAKGCSLIFPLMMASATVFPK